MQFVCRQLAKGRTLGAAREVGQSGCANNWASWTSNRRLYLANRQRAHLRPPTMDEWNHRAVDTEHERVGCTGRRWMLAHNAGGFGGLGGDQHCASRLRA